MPDALHERLRRYAEENGCTMSAAVIRAVEREMETGEWKRRLAERPATYMTTSAVDLIASERASRDAKPGTEAE